MGIDFMNRGDCGLFPVGSYHEAEGTTRAFPYFKDHAAFNGLVVHHTVTSEYLDHNKNGYDRAEVNKAMQALRVMRPDLGPDIPYSFVVFPGEDADSCIVAEGRGFWRVGAHTENWNSKRYGVALWGNYQTRKPTHGQQMGIRWLGAWLAPGVGSIQPAMAHRNVSATACPGRNMNDLMWTVQPPYSFDRL
jgi:hypothetical protein